MLITPKLLIWNFIGIKYTRKSFWKITKSFVMLGGTDNNVVTTYEKEDFYYSFWIFIYKYFKIVIKCTRKFCNFYENVWWYFISSFNTHLDYLLPHIELCETKASELTHIIANLCLCLPITRWQMIKRLIYGWMLRVQAVRPFLKGMS